jgi:hypothetical protein
MKRQRHSLEIPRKKARNIARPGSTFIEQIRAAGRNAQSAANQPSNLRSMRHIRATLANEPVFEEVTLGLGVRFFRWLIALLLLPLCIVTTWTLFSEFSLEAQQQQFWLSRETWFFTLGSIIMAIAFYSGLLRRFFLYLYVLGHELTHAFFVIFHLGQVTEMKVSTDGGYIATNKSNILISLSPYFFPFWSVSLISLYGILAWCIELPHDTDMLFYGALGMSWTFHLCWTLWMIPRDQPDLRENDTFFSLVFIYFINILILSLMLCAASQELNFLSFFASWWVHAEEMARWCWDACAHYRLKMQG